MGPRPDRNGHGPTATATAEWGDADDVHNPGTYVHGFYDRETAILGGRPVLNENLVNLPNCLVMHTSAVAFIARRGARCPEVSGDARPAIAS